ncbi:MAG TPA: ABC transporter ATP-binding protein [Bacillota bacterium]|jgi:ABC-2 type transport system ATP-binding protein|nr:ABC transporter ATP-binding protein [Bacillota bacterium]
MLEICELVKTYPNGTQALRGLSFSVEPGEVFGILGPNGAGKTTLLKLMVGVLTPTSGWISLDGVNPQNSPISFRKLLGVVHQFGSFDLTLSIWDNLNIYGAFHGLPKHETSRRINHLLERLDLVAKKHEPIENLSGGQRRKVQIARALLHRPKFLFLDEPTTGLDVYSRKQIWDIVREEASPAPYIIFTSHNVDEAEKQCDRVLIINQGTSIALDTPQRLIDSIIGHRIEIRFEGQPADGLEQTLEANPLVYSAEIHNSTLRLRVEAPSKCLPQILECCSQHGIAATSVVTRSASLEDVLLKSTGRELN